MKAICDSIEINGITYNKGEILYDASSAFMWGYTMSGVLTVYIDKIELIDDEAYGVEYRPLANRTVKLGDIICWKSRENCEKYLDLMKWIHKDETFCLEHWEEYCNKVEELRNLERTHKKDRGTER